jgi:hypothetical protein
MHSNIQSHGVSKHSVLLTALHQHCQHETITILSAKADASSAETSGHPPRLQNLAAVTQPLVQRSHPGAHQQAPYGCQLMMQSRHVLVWAIGLQTANRRPATSCNAPARVLQQSCNSPTTSIGQIPAQLPCQRRIRLSPCMHASSDRVGRGECTYSPGMSAGCQSCLTGVSQAATASGFSWSHRAHLVVRSCIASSRACGSLALPYCISYSARSAKEMGQVVKLRA